LIQKLERNNNILITEASNIRLNFAIRLVNFKSATTPYAYYYGCVQCWYDVVALRRLIIAATSHTATNSALTTSTAAAGGDFLGSATDDDRGSSS